MPNDILDDFGREEKADYANKSVRHLVMAVAAYILILLLGGLLLGRYQVGIIGPALLFSIALFAFISTLLGLASAVLGGVVIIRVLKLVSLPEPLSSAH